MALQEQKERLTEAIQTAVSCYGGRMNESTGQLAILHAMETLQILCDMQAEDNSQIAGVLLHCFDDSVEEQQEEIKVEIANRYGQNIVESILLQKRDPQQIWAIQNTSLLERMAQSSEQDKLVFFADQLAALRDLKRQHALYGDGMWNNWLKTAKEKYAWFTNGVLEICRIFAEGEYTADFYSEMANLYKDLFVVYTIDPTFTQIYQANAFGQAHCLTKGTASWVPVNYRFRQEDIPLSRKEAESLEEKWYDIILTTVEEDCTGEYEISANGLTVRLEQAVISCHDEASGQMISFYEEESYDFLLRLREQFGVTMTMEEIWKDLLYSFRNPWMDFLQLSRQLGLHPAM